MLKCPMANDQWTITKATFFDLAVYHWIHITEITFLQES